MRRFFRYLTQALLLVVVFLISAMTAMRFAIHGREVAVPKLIGMVPSEAEQATAKLGLVLQRDTRYFSTTVPAGRIMSQNPPEGEKVRGGWRVRVAESMGPQRAVIPDLMGESTRAAEMNIRRRGLDLGSVVSISMPSSAADTVVAQSPPANATGVISPKVSLLVSTSENRETYIMPDLTGMPLDTVIKIVTESGFTIGTVRTATSPGGTAQPAKTGAQVVSHDPAPGQRIAAKGVVNVEVAR